MEMKSANKMQIIKEEKKNSLFLIILVISSLILAFVSLIDLEAESKISIKRGLALFFNGLVFFTTLYLLLNSIMLNTKLGLKFIQTYKLSIADVYDISNKQVSAVQAIFCVLTGLTCCTYSCSRDLLRTSHFISEGYAWFGAAYFFYDIWGMYQVHQAKSGSVSFTNYLKTHPVIVGHHLFIGGFGFLVITWLRGGLGDCFFGFVYLMEASTPFVSLRGILSKIGMKESKFYVWNGLVMLGSFFVCRVVMFPCVIYVYAQSINLNYFDAVMSLPRGCKISILILLLPQIYWFYLMVKGATQVLVGNKKTTVNALVRKNTKTKKN